MSEHTPGPWEIDRDLVSGSDGDDVAYIALRAIGGDKSEMESNANLIAAAPDLLQWLQVILDHVDYTSDACSLTEPVGAVLSMYVIKQARAAIVRAEGKAQ